MGKELEEFRRFGHEMVHYIADYFESLSERQVSPQIAPGLLQKVLPSNAPDYGEPFDDILKDFDTKILPNVIHQLHPRFHGFFPTGYSYPSVMADLLCDAINHIGLTWVSDPACTEVEMVMMDWLAKMIGLPSSFLRLESGSKGGGVIQGSTTESTFINLLTARYLALQHLKHSEPSEDSKTFLPKLVAYCSREAYCTFDKAAKLVMVPIKVINTNNRFEMKADELNSTIKSDIDQGLIPIFVLCTLGTASCCSYDPLKEIGPICEKYKVFLHVEAAYAGNALICPEFRHILQGIEYADSFSMNPSSWLPVNFDCCCFWVKNKYHVTQSMAVDPLYLQHAFSDEVLDYRHWSITLSRRFRSLKLWFVIRFYGIEGLQKHIRDHIRLAKLFESFVKADKRFTVENEVTTGLVCFRLKDSNEMNKRLLFSINDSGKLYMVSAMLEEKYVLRFAVCSPQASEDDIIYAWEVITSHADKVLKGEDDEQLTRFALEHCQEMFAKTLSIRHISE